MTCNTVTNLGTLDTVQLIRGDTNTETHRAVSLCPVAVAELKVTETHDPQG